MKACIKKCSGGGVVKKVQWFDAAENIFDLFRGDTLNLSFPEVARLSQQNDLTDMLVMTSWAPSTRKLYHGWVLLFVRFCMLLDMVALPADPVALGRFITAMSCMYSTSTVHVAMSAIIGWHSLHDLQNPVRASTRLARMWTAVRRFNGGGVRRKKAVCDHKFIAGMYEKWQVLYRHGLTSWVQVRDMAWFLVGWEAGLRVSEVCKLTVCCWMRLRSGSVDLKVVQAKNNRWLSMAADRARLVRASELLSVAPSAVRFVEEVWFPFLVERGVLPQDWLVRLLRDGQIRGSRCRFSECSAFVCDSCPPLFPTFPTGGLAICRWPGGVVTQCSMHLMSRSHVSKQVKVWAQSIGLDPSQFSGISFRRGGVSVAAMQKVDLELRMKQFRWLSEETPHVYTDVGDLEKEKVGKALHKAVLNQQQVLSKDSSKVSSVSEVGECCRRCGSPDTDISDILLCDGCPAAFHLTCLTPVLRVVPKGDWFCPGCVQGR